MAEIYFMKNDYANSVVHYEKRNWIFKACDLANVLLTNNYSNLALSYLSLIRLKMNPESKNST